MSSLSEALRQGVLEAGNLRDRLGISRATLMRWIHAAGDEIVQIGRTRSTRYGLRQAWQGLGGSEFPLFRVNESGAAVPAGDLVTLAARQTVWLPEGLVTDGLPTTLADARPSGFLGRHFSAIHADLQLPTRLSDWSDHHVLMAMSRRGEDLTGNLLIGEESFARWRALDIPAKTPDAYPDLANATIAGHPPGSSAGGERPKFGAFVDGRHVLVKFSGRGGGEDRVSRRWCDLLVMEALALDVVSSRGISAARTRILVMDSYYFLESERFDRIGLRGRVGVLSLAALHDDPADSWARAANLFRDTGRLDAEEARRLIWLDAFGAFIANTDRHAYNIVFFQEGPTLRLAPAFDQVSMFYAPTADGQVPPRVYTFPQRRTETLEVWDDARQGAQEFWRRVSDDPRLSDEVRRFSTTNIQQLTSL